MVIWCCLGSLSGCRLGRVGVFRVRGVQAKRVRAADVARVGVGPSIVAASRAAFWGSSRGAGVKLAASVANVLRALYVDLDGTLLGPGGSLFSSPDGFSLMGARALQACDRAGVEVVLVTGRKQPGVYEIMRLIGQRSYIFELGCGLVVDGELEWLTGGCVPSVERGTIYDQIEASGAPKLLLETYAGQLEYHLPFSEGREVSHAFRGFVPAGEVSDLLRDAGLGWLRLVDNGVVHARDVTGGVGVAGSHAATAVHGLADGVPAATDGAELPAGVGSRAQAGSCVEAGSRAEAGSRVGAGSRAGAGSRVEAGLPAETWMLAPGSQRIHAYHLIPGCASKAVAVARHMQNRGYTADQCIACGDSREDLEIASALGTFWMMANGVERDPTISSELAVRSNVRVAEAGFGAGVYEAVASTLAKRTDPS